MSVTVQTSSIIPLNGYHYYFEAFQDGTDSVFHNCISFRHSKTLRTMHQFPSFSAISFHSDYTQISNESMYSGTDWKNPAYAKHNKYFEYETNGFNAGENELNFSSTYNEKCQENCITSDSGSTSKIWRPFQVDSQTEENVLKMNNDVENKIMFHSIKPSNVKIGHSKTSVFKAVKRNNFSCPQCSSRYLSNRQLNTHMRIHTGSKPFRCEYPNCFKSFARNEELTRHKRIHSGFKPHLCTVCKKRFGRKDHLSKHLKTHLQTSEKKIYQCSFPGCGHRYTRSDALTRHKSTAHSIKSKK